MDDERVVAGHLVELEHAIPLADGMGMIGRCVICGMVFTAYTGWLEVPLEHQEVRHWFFAGEGAA